MPRAGAVAVRHCQRRRRVLRSWELAELRDVSTRPLHHLFHSHRGVWCFVRVVPPVLGAPAVAFAHPLAHCVKDSDAVPWSVSVPIPLAGPADQLGPARGCKVRRVLQRCHASHPGPGRVRTGGMCCSAGACHGIVALFCVPHSAPTPPPSTLTLQVRVVLRGCSRGADGNVHVPCRHRRGAAGANGLAQAALSHGGEWRHAERNHAVACTLQVRMSARLHSPPVLRVLACARLHAPPNSPPPPPKGPQLVQRL